MITQHPDDDTLLKYVLEILDDADDAATRDHVTRCGQCAARCRELSKPIDRITTVQFKIQEVAAPRFPRRKRSMSAVVIRAAAILAAGFLAGYLTAGWTALPPTLSVPQHLEPESPATTLPHFTSCDQIDLAVRQWTPGPR